ncbi:MAG: GNAT family N-acetyltransferase [Acidimicrobiales bacterium]
MNDKSGNAAVWVSVLDGRVVGYYALASAGVERETAPEALKRGGVPQQLPCVLLARLAVDKSMQGKGLGRALVQDALNRIIGASEQIGIRAILIHAKDDEARAFYLKLAEFRPSPTDPLHLLLSVKNARAAVSSIPTQDKL